MRRAALPAFALGVALASGANAAPIQIVVNGREIETSVIETNGAIYVPIDTLSKALGVTLSIKTNEPPPPAPAPVAAAPAATPPAVASPLMTTVLLSVPSRPVAVPSITGKLTYHLNLFETSAPDPGARVWLVNEGDVATLTATTGGTADEPISQRAVGWDVKLTGQYQFPHRVADGHGEFAFEDVAPGAYLLIFQSVRANGLAARDRQGKMRSKKVVVHPGETVEASLNFGVTAYKD